MEEITWDYEPPVGVDFFMHQLSVMRPLAQADDQIFRESRGCEEGNLLKCDSKAASILRALPQFMLKDEPPADGSQVLGNLGRWKVIRKWELPEGTVHMKSGSKTVTIKFNGIPG